MSKREEIQEYVGKFVDGLTRLMRAAASEAVDAAFGDSPGATDSEQPEPVKHAATKAPRRAAAPKPATPTAGLQKQVLTAIRANPFCDARVIANAVGKTPIQIRPLLNDLAASGTVKRTGMGRGVRYSL